MTDAKARRTDIDILYAIGAVLAVFGHTHPLEWELIYGTLYSDAIVFIYTFHMPLFFFISGFLIFYSKSIVRDGYIKWVGNKAMKLLTPYVALTVIALIPKYYLQHHSLSGLNAQFIVRTLLVPRDNIWGHLWFLPVLFTVYLLFGALVSWFRKLAPANRWFVCCLSLLFMGILHFLPLECPWFGITDVFIYAIFCSMGIVLAEFISFKSQHLVRKKRATTYMFVAALDLLVISFCIYRFYGNIALMQFIITCFMLTACWLVSQSIGENMLVGWLSRNVFTIYLFSWPFQAVVEMLRKTIGMNWMIASLAMFVVGFAGPAILLLLYGRFKKMHCKFFDLLLGIRAA